MRTKPLLAPKIALLTIALLTAGLPAASSLMANPLAPADRDSAHDNDATPGADLPPPTSPARPGETLGPEKIQQIRDELTNGGLLETIHAAARLADIPLSAGHTIPNSFLPHFGDVSEEVPPGLVEPIANLVSGQQEAAHHVQAALPADTDPSMRSDDAAFFLLQPRTTATANNGFPPATEPSFPLTGPYTPTVQATTVLDRAAGLAGQLDQPTMTKGALILAQAVEDAIPQLEAYAQASLEETSEDSAAGCDVVDEAPILCIGGVGDNTYDPGDYAVQIDLGGNDTFHNAPGSADTGALHDGQGNGLAAAVAVTLGGNDTYDTATGLYAEGHEGATGVQGAGITGIGMLVDTGGDDAYRASGAHEDQDASGQGYGIAGIGILDDRSGDDEYELSAIVDNGASLGQGAGSLGGLGVLIDRAEGTDTYLASASPGPRIWRSGGVYPGPVTVHAQGSAAGGSGAVFFDGGGVDEVRIDARSQPIAPDDPREQADVIAIAGGIGQGYADLASGALALTGEGPTSWSLVSEGQAPWSGQRQAHGMGSASGDSFAALYDAGGDDAYTMKTISQAQHEVAVRDDCECFGAFAEAQAGGPRQAAFAYLSVYSTGMGSGTGVILDTGGDDAYHMEGQATADAVAHDNRTQTSGDDAEEIGALATADASYVTMIGQGSGSDLWDLGGNDAYSFHVNAEAEAKANAQLEDAHETAKAGTGDVRGYAQGASGLLFDQGGMDAYGAIVSTHARADPPTGVESPSPVLVAQPGESGALVDVDGGGEDTFSTTPNSEPCEGDRGDTVWIECDGGVGANVALVPSGGMQR